MLCRDGQWSNPLSVAQSGRALGLEPRGRRFKSCHSDQFLLKGLRDLLGHLRVLERPFMTFVWILIAAIHLHAANGGTVHEVRAAYDSEAGCMSAAQQMQDIVPNRATYSCRKEPLR